MYYTIDPNLVKALEEHFNIPKKEELSLEEIHVFFIVNSFNSQGKPCKVTSTTFRDQLRISNSTLSRVKNRLKEKGLVSIYRDPNHRTQHISDTLHLSKKAKQFVTDYQKALFQGEIGLFHGDVKAISQGKGNSNIGGFTHPLGDVLNPEQEEPKKAKGIFDFKI